MANGEKLQLQNVLKDYWIGPQLGTGARSVVFEVKSKEDGRTLAVKFVAGESEDDLRVIGHLENEYRVLKDIHSTPGDGSSVIVKPIEFKKVKRFFKVRGAYLVMERAQGRSLFDYGEYSIPDVLTIFRQTCLGLEHMHKVGYVHADLKPQNILVDGDLNVKLIDFGFAAKIGQQLKNFKGTFGYLAPEQAGGRLTEKTDVFNLGAALYRVLTGENVPSIMPGQSETRGFVPDQQIRISSLHRINPDVPEELSEIVIKCISAREHERPTVTQLKRYLHGLQLRLDFDNI